MSQPLETRCPTCGADLPITPGSRVATCKFCQKEFFLNDDDERVEGDDEDDAGEETRRRPSVQQTILLGAVLVLVVLSIAGFGRWTGSSSTSLAAMPSRSSTPPPTADQQVAPSAQTPASTPATSTGVIPSKGAPSGSGGSAKSATSRTNRAIECDMGCIKGTDPGGNPIWIGGNGGAGLPCCGELAEAKAAKPPTTAACDSTCWYNGRCQILMSGSSGLPCCKPIKDEFGCSSK